MEVARCKHSVPSVSAERAKNRNCLRLELSPDTEVLRCLLYPPSHWPKRSDGKNEAMAWYFSGGDVLALRRCVSPVTCIGYEVVS